MPLCSNCLIDLQTEEAYKEHYKSEWHRYNIKRRMINLAPVDESTFQKKLQEQYQKQKGAFQCDKALHYCKYCNKSFTNDRTYKAHLETNKHIQNLKAYQGQKVTEESDNNEIAQTKTTLDGNNICLFCDKEEANFDDSYKHMKISHGFFIREEDCLVDRDGLIKALAEQININQTCLHCYETFKTSKSAKQHMLDKGHCFMPEQVYKVLSRFYNFEEKLQKLINEQHKMMAIVNGQETKQLQDDQPRNKKLNELQKLEDQGEQDDWEDEEDENDSDYEDKDSDEESEEETDQKVLDKQKRLKQQLRELKQFKAKLLKGGELQLPNGKILGHRLLRKYYKQNHIPFPTNKEEMLEYAKEQFDIDLQNQDENQIIAYDEKFFEKYLKKHYNALQQKDQMKNLRIGMQNNKIQRRWFRAQC